MNRIFTALLIAPIRFYQWTLSPILGRQCKYHPTCSHYTIEALRVHGPLRGLALGAKRIAACHPFAKGGFDPVPPRK
jgi:putative membrane protein insertion efficiency factor